MKILQKLSLNYHQISSNTHLISSAVDSLNFFSYCIILICRTCIAMPTRSWVVCCSCNMSFRRQVRSFVAQYGQPSTCVVVTTVSMRSSTAQYGQPSTCVFVMTVSMRSSTAQYGQPSTCVFVMTVSMRSSTAQYGQPSTCVFVMTVSII